MNELRRAPKEKWCFGIGAIGKDAIVNLVGAFLMLYFTDTLGIASSFVGVLFFVARMWDAVNDPVMGMIVDNTRTKHGKFRIWLHDLHHHGRALLVLAAQSVQRPPGAGKNLRHPPHLRQPGRLHYLHLRTLHDRLLQ